MANPIDKRYSLEQLPFEAGRTRGVVLFDVMRRTVPGFIVEVLLQIVPFVQFLHREDTLLALRKIAIRSMSSRRRLRRIAFLTTDRTESRHCSTRFSSKCISRVPSVTKSNEKEELENKWRCVKKQRQNMRYEQQRITDWDKQCLPCSYSHFPPTDR